MPMFHSSSPPETTALRVAEHIPPGKHLKIRAVLTDFDGIIIDHERLMVNAYGRLATAHLYHHGDVLFPDAMRALVGQRDPHELPDSLDHVAMCALFKHGSEVYDQTHPTHLHADAEKVFATYEEKHIPWAVISNNELTTVRWQSLGLQERFPNVPIYDNAGKPSAKALDKALKTLNQQVGKDVIMIDDGWAGLVAAAKLGVTPVYMGDDKENVVNRTQHECRRLGIAPPCIFSVRNNAELAQFVRHGIPLTNETAQYLW